MLEVRPFSFHDRVYRQLSRRGPVDATALATAVSQVITSIYDGGDNALCRAAGEHFGTPVALNSLRISPEEIAEARAEVGERFLTALSLARVNIRKFHEYQKTHGYVHDDGDGVMLCRRVRPLRRIGMLARRSFIDVLMCAVPAQVAGVDTIALAVPPDATGKIDPYILATAGVFSIDEIYRLPGLPAVAAFAYGTETVQPVETIVGPGGPLGEEAKRQVRHRVGAVASADAIDLTVIADASANARFIARDTTAHMQAYADGRTVILTDDRMLAEAIRIEVGRLLPEGDPPDSAMERIGLFLCTDIPQAIRASEELAPSAVIVMTADDSAWLPDIENAGLVMAGAWTPEAVASLYAGCNAMLPASGTANFRSSLGVSDFVKETVMIRYSPERLSISCRHASELARSAHCPDLAEAADERTELLRLSSG